MVRSYSQTWFITKDNVRRTNTREKGSGRPRTMFLDWLLKTEEDKISYDELKMLAKDRSRWRQWRWKPAIWAEYYSSSFERWLWMPWLLASTYIRWPALPGCSESWSGLDVSWHADSDPWFMCECPEKLHIVVWEKRVDLTEHLLSRLAITMLKCALDSSYTGT